MYKAKIIGKKKVYTVARIFGLKKVLPDLTKFPIPKPSTKLSESGLKGAEAKESVFHKIKSGSKSRNKKETITKT